MIATVLAQMMDRGDMNGGGGNGWWWLMALGVILVVALVVVLVVMLTRHNAAPSSPAGNAPSTARAPEEVLADRLARGEIDAEEYRARREALRS
jgi:putative membrane protein